MGVVLDTQAASVTNYSTSAAVEVGNRNWGGVYRNAILHPRGFLGRLNS